MEQLKLHFGMKKCIEKCIGFAATFFFIKNDFKKRWKLFIFLLFGGFWGRSLQIRYQKTSRVHLGLGLSPGSIVRRWTNSLLITYPEVFGIVDHESVVKKPPGCTKKMLSHSSVTSFFPMAILSLPSFPNL